MPLCTTVSAETCMQNDSIFAMMISEHDGVQYRAEEAVLADRRRIEGSPQITTKGTSSGLLHTRIRHSHRAARLLNASHDDGEESWRAS